MTFDKKYRPKTLDDFYGNKELKSSLKSILKKKNFSCVLLLGESGCGKTTLARIIAKELGAESFGLKEYNISNMTGIDTAREIIKKAQYKSLHSKSKVFVLNECHKASNSFQNAMLEILEEPPEKVYFILCTTEPNKLLKTIRTRAIHLEVNRLTRKNMHELIKSVVRKEKIRISKSIISHVSKLSEGIPRQALLLLDTVSGMCDDEEDEIIIEALKRFQINENTTLELAQALMNNAKWVRVVRILNNVKEEPETVRHALKGLLTKELMRTGNSIVADILSEFMDNYYDSGKSGLVYSCFNALQYHEDEKF